MMDVIKQTTASLMFIFLWILCSTASAQEDVLGNDGPSVNVPKVVFSLIICILGLIGNLVAIFVILVLKEYQKSVTHWYVLQLAIADSLFLLTLPFKVSEDINNSWIYPEWMCKAKETILFLNYYASILFLMIMSIDRYIAVCHTFSDFLQKLRKQTTATIIALCTWAVALLICIPVMLYSFKIGVYPDCKCSYEFPNVRNETALCVEEGFVTPLEIEECLNLSRNSIVDSPSGELYCRPLPSFQLPGGPDSIDNQGTAVYELGNGDLSNYGSYASSGQYPSGDFSAYSGNSGGGGGGDIITASCHYWDRPAGWIAFLAFNFAVMFILPFFVMVLCYGLIVHKLSTTRMSTTNTPSTSSVTQTTINQSSASQKKRKKSSSKSSKDRRRVTIMCAALVASFVICWLPFHAIHLAKVAGIQTSNPEICDILPAVGSLLAYLNSALNPYLYSFLGTNFSRRWNTATHSVRKSFKRRRSSSSAPVGSARFNKKKSGKDGSTSNTGTVMTKIYRNPNDKTYLGSETRQSMEVSHTVAYNSETQQLNAITNARTDHIENDTAPPEYEESLTLNYDNKV